MEVKGGTIMMKEEYHVFQGMSRGNHQIKQDSKFLWDAHNIRITDRGDNTGLSITNEKGTELIHSVTGHYLGHCVLNEHLVIFSRSLDGSINHIKRVSINDSGKVISITLYSGSLGFDATLSTPIEAIGVYENELIQKVYWTDGINQPRVINITKPELKGEEIVEGKDYSYLYPRGSFDFVRRLNLNEDVEVKRIEGNGMFSPGTIQYAFSYFNKYEQETKIFYTTPINYISHLDRGGSPEDKIANSFEIKIENPDKNFEYIRIYSIHRTSIDAVPTVKIVEDVPVPKAKEDEVVKVVFTDDGTKGSTIDPTLLLYVGGREFIAGCIASKDNTLFLGNIKLPDKQITELKGELQKSNNYSLVDLELPSVSEDITNEATYYSYNSQLLKGYTAGFKANEKYRLGVQVQTANGEWSDPIHIKDDVLNDSFVTNGARHSKSIVFTNAAALRNTYKVKRIRACVVFPKTYERDIICQGVLCPTVFNVGHRSTESPYAESSWFFRPATNLEDTTKITGHGSIIEYRHNKPLFTGKNTGAEIQNMIEGEISPDKISGKEINKYSPYYFIDENIVTFHSPDIEFDTNLSNFDWSGVKLRITGMAQLGAISGDIDIQTETPAAKISNGFNHKTEGYSTKWETTINGGLISGYFYNSGVIKNDYSVNENGVISFLVYPWHRSGSLNNDTARTEGTDKEKSSIRTAVLSKKVISNLKFFSKNIPVWSGTPEKYDIWESKISTPQLFNSNELDISKIHISYLGSDVPYMGNIDSLLTSSIEYPIFTASGGELPDMIETGNDPVRIKYKSSPHLVFTLNSDVSGNKIKLLPRHSSIRDVNEPDIILPNWVNVQYSDYNGEIETPNEGDIVYLGFGAFKQADSSYAETVTSSIIDKDSPNINLKDGVYAYDFAVSPDGYTNLSALTLGVKKTSPGNDQSMWDYNVVTNISDDTEVHLRPRVTKTKYPTRQYLGIPVTDWKSIPNEDYYIYIGNERTFRVKNQNVSSGQDRFPNFYYHILEEKSKNRSKVKSANTGSFSVDRSPLTTGSQEEDNKVPPYLLLAELVRTVPEDIKFGGNSEEALKNNLWIPAGSPVSIKETDTSVSVPFEFGDTWYSRYDCLKTYPFTKEDENQIVEIGSFMCETRVNIDGRYDRNRGLTSNLNITPQNFNLLNNVYSQKDNFFNYRILDKDYYKQNVFANQVTWSKEKHAGEDIDTWTDITLASTLDMDGNKGKVNSIKEWNGTLLCFQDRAISKINFNDRVQIPVSDGTPIEITNGYKVDGKTTISDIIGCLNKWSIVTTPRGVYFIDTTSGSIYLFNGESPINLSQSKGMDWWVKSWANKPWVPESNTVDTPVSIRSFYDSIYEDVYFIPSFNNTVNSEKEALCYSEKLGQFTSFMYFDDNYALANFNNSLLCLNAGGQGRTNILKYGTGPYNDFFGITKDWSFSFISNDNPNYTKVFDTIDLKADQYSEGTLLNSCPVTSIGVSNEYQKAQVEFNDRTMRKKFRIWRGQIPRNSGTMQRIRNPWTMITLGGKGDGSNAIVHDVTVHYTI